MSRPSPTLSVSSSAPVIGNGHAHTPQVPKMEAPRGARSHSFSTSKLPTVNDSQGGHTDPDELFARHTISEVKVVQHQLRADADAKQEELRLMVGERYRDLLQASTSIIAIASSSKRVVQTLEETRDIVLSQEEPPMPRRQTRDHGNDAHLHTLQLLSAHMKLLLDAPEHLWRLIERKQYLSAAWLFLLARVVHRALVRDDEQEEGTWSSQGVDVLEEFPLVQRQWEAVSQFRSQIIHKATLSLRECNASTEDTCAALLTLHLLDSRPLTETLSVFLAQRSKTLHDLLSWEYPGESPRPQEIQMNGGPLGSLQANTTSTSDFRRRPVNEIKEATQTALDAISRAMKTAQSIFDEESESQRSLVRRVLECIQSDSPNPTNKTQSLPAVLSLTTQTLLTTLPSSSHFLLLPANLRSYKPYIDLTSSSSTIRHSYFTQKMREWFEKSCSHLQKAVARWFSTLLSVKEVWNVRAATKRWLLASCLGENEVFEVTSILDKLCQHRMIEIWKLKLAGSLESFSSRLESTVSSLSKGSKSTRKGITLVFRRRSFSLNRVVEISPVQFLFQTPLLPTLSQAGMGQADASFQKYKASLRRQLLGRSTLLDDVLATLENCARTIRQDLAHVMASGEETRELYEQLENNYRPGADALCNDVVDKLEETVKAHSEASFSNIEGMIFLGRVSDELSSSSPFIIDLGCQPPVARDFRDKTAKLYGRVLDRWRRHMVSQIVREHRLAYRPIHHTLQHPEKPWGPSPDIVQSLFVLSTSIQELGFCRNQSRQQSLVLAALEHFIAALTGDGWDENSLQSSYDLAFLWKFAAAYGEGLSELANTLEKRLKDSLPSELTLDDLHRSASESLARTQTLLAILLPFRSSIPLSESADKFSALLPFGIPPVEHEFHPALELAKPTSRFGLLLVGGM
ncbi:hypothetical protein H0H81_010293 [Sphagnurus paluster]|uniref:Conserved oligomeric Golgi complex subunit 1 n=1 Tax=Sphagnurus paluster TaxID=117069 RepID=A0A9P7GJ46_9AGAR|nr:hypothetical protein H0H81_010293 [Sphagnurus paluster]